MQLSSPTLAMQPRTVTNDTSLVVLLLEREEKMQAKTEKLREDMEAKMAPKTEKMEQQMERMREEMKPAPPPAEVISSQQIEALQARVEALHTAKLLGDDEIYKLEDMLADYLELKPMIGTATLEKVNASEVASKLLKLLSLSEGIVADGAFARQARRKFS